MAPKVEWNEGLAEDDLPVDLDDVIRALKIVKTNLKSKNAAKISSHFIVISVHMFGVHFRKASEANACERGGSAGVIYVVSIFYVCLFAFH
jgi:hypothetical protein